MAKNKQSRPFFVAPFYALTWLVILIVTFGHPEKITNNQSNRNKFIIIVTLLIVGAAIVSTVLGK